MIARFNFYDFIANLVPGLFFLWCASVMLAMIGCRVPLDFTGGLAETSIIVTVGYVAGLMLQAVSEQFVQRKILLPMWGGFPSSRWLLPDDPQFSKSYKKNLLALIAKRFDVSVEPEIPANATDREIHEARLKKNSELFYLCYRYTDSLGPYPQTFNALFGMFRCFLSLFALLCAMAFIGLIIAIFGQHASAGKFLVLTALFGVCGWLSYAQCKKRSDDFARSVYDLFVSGVAKKSGE